MFRYLAICLLLLAALPARAELFGDVLHHLFVTHPASQLITVIDTRDDKIAGTLDIGLVPIQLEGSGDLAKLVAIDGQTQRVHLHALTSGRLQRVALDFVPQRIVLNSKGLKAAAFSAESGQIAVIDLLYAIPLGSTYRHRGVRDLLFDRQGSVLHIADHKGIQRLDLETGRTLRRIGPVGAVTRLAPSANGRFLYATTSDGRIHPVAIEPDAVPPGPTIGRTEKGTMTHRSTPASIATGTSLGRAYTNATGTRLFLPDGRRRTLSIVSPGNLAIQAELPATGGLGHVYSAWFDTVAFIPSVEGPRVLVFDQENALRGADIPLPANAGRSVVTPDGAKFYLPLADDKSLVVIDANTRRLATRIKLDAPPLATLMAVTFGICH